MNKKIICGNSIMELKGLVEEFRNEHDVVSLYYKFNTVEYHSNQEAYVEVVIMYK